MILTEKFLLNSKNSKPFLLGIAYMPVFVLYSILRKAMGHYTLVKRNRFRLMWLTLFMARFSFYRIFT